MRTKQEIAEAAHAAAGHITQNSGLLASIVRTLAELVHDLAVTDQATLVDQERDRLRVALDGLDRMDPLVDAVLRASLKHGPDGKGGAGSCDASCLKCARERYLSSRSEGR